MRHYVNLSKRNFDLDSGFYPLGSCTMKHNPRLHERVAALPGHARLHPLQDAERAQGALELMWNLERALAEIAGLPHVSLQPSAGSHGELAGVLLTRAYHEDRGETRHKVLTPDTAHGTNPATVTMAGYEVVKVGTNEDGGVDLDDLRAKADEDVACLMLTNPNTLGIFDPNIEEIAKIVHGVGATLYYDGANLNAVMGKSRPGDMGFDIVHFNLHKSFTQPHGGGGPGSGPIAVCDRIEPYLHEARDQAGRGVQRLARRALRARRGPAEVDRPPARLPGQLRDASCAPTPTSARSAPRACGTRARPRCSTPTTCSRGCARGRRRRTCRWPSGSSACTSSCCRGAPMKKELGIKTLDLAKRLLDHGFHPPTVYFPLLVDEALLVEPTETETRETLDAFASARRRDPARGARTTPRSRRTRRTRRRCAGSTRPARRSGRSSASRRTRTRSAPLVRSPRSLRSAVFRRRRWNFDCSDRWRCSTGHVSSPSAVASGVRCSRCSCCTRTKSSRPIA